MHDDIYNARILQLAADIPHTGHLAHPDAHARAVSRLCGSTVEVDICWRGGKVSDFAQDVRACVLGQASCSIVARHIIGCGEEELRSLAKTMRAMLKENGASPEGRWRDLAILQPVRDYRARHASTLLVFGAVEECLDQIKAKGK